MPATDPGTPIALYPISLAPSMTLPLRVEIHVARRRCRSLFAVVEKVRLAIGHADQHEAAATDISGRRMHHGQRESGGHRGVDGIAAGLHDLDTGTRCQLVHAHHDGMLRVNRMRGAPGGRRRRSATEPPSATKSMICAGIACQIEEPRIAATLEASRGGKRSQIWTQNRGDLSYRRDSSFLRHGVYGR